MGECDLVSVCPNQLLGQSFHLHTKITAHRCGQSLSVFLLFSFWIPLGYLFYFILSIILSKFFSVATFFLFPHSPPPSLLRQAFVSRTALDVSCFCHTLALIPFSNRSLHAAVPYLSFLSAVIRLVHLYHIRNLPRIECFWPLYSDPYLDAENPDVETRNL
jgi:hypothetical protein